MVNFAPAHHAEARPALVAELGLDVVEVLRHLAVALDLVARDVGDHLLRRRLDDEVALVRSRPAASSGPSCPSARSRSRAPPAAPPASAVRPRRHGHLLADDGLDLADHAQAHRHVVVDAGGDFAGSCRRAASALADDLGVGGASLRVKTMELHEAGVRSGAGSGSCRALPRPPALGRTVRRFTLRRR